MSWMSKNYHLVALGGGALALAGLGYLGLNSSKAAAAQLNIDEGRAKENTEVINPERPNEVAKSIAEVQPMQNPVIEERPINLFTTVPLFVRKGDFDNAVDILVEPPVHDGIDNDWWVKYGVDPGFSDSPEQDFDADGYSNQEEYDFQTDPSDDKSYPALVHKLDVVKIDTVKWRLRLNSVLGNGNIQFRFEQVLPDGKVETNRISAIENVKVGDVFFKKKDPAKNRFKVVKMRKREVTRNGVTTQQDLAEVVDLKPHKDQTPFDVFFRPRDELLKKITRYDDIVHIRLNAVGQEGKVYKVEPNTSFKVTVDGQTRTYKLIEVKRDEAGKPISVEVEYTKTDGSKAIRSITVG